MIDVPEQIEAVTRTLRTEEIDAASLSWSGSLFAAADTILGPLYLGWGLAEGGRNTFFLSLGLPL